ncbi:rhombosortase [Shewanella sp. WXL01]|uniref:Rhombosortase n=1 Tax=Shewanella maritima TaxID=2520507 RepID=A0A411PMC8_9GAMM|nr:MULTISPECIES: rhombosortase [Shewanella]NKF52582.1 rhombosortase [Shewanella sp. WXL01]QBF84697.1 rhombosortase [Shewanella maritima]
MLGDKGASPYHVLILTSLICIVLFAMDIANFGFDVSNTLAYRRDKIEFWQVWRLVTGNFLHTNLWHLLMNLAGLWIIVFLHEIHYKHHVEKLVLLIFSLCLFEGVGLFFLYPDLNGFVGLSGILHGLFAFGAIMDVRKGFRSGYLLLIGVIMKVMYEQYFGSLQGMSSLIEARVATESHFVGLFVGIAIGLFWLPLANRFKRRNR